jgi:hypothetical protein
VRTTTGVRKMATLSEHADRIKAAIQAAVEDGYRVDVDVSTVYYNGEVEEVEVDIFDGPNYINLLRWDYT